MRASENPSTPTLPNLRYRHRKMDPAQCKLILKLAVEILPAEYVAQIKETVLDTNTPDMHPENAYDVRSEYLKQPHLRISFPRTIEQTATIAPIFNKWTYSNQDFLIVDIHYEDVLDILREIVTYELLLNPDWKNKTFWHPKLLFADNLALMNVLVNEKEKAIERLSRLGIPAAVMAGEDPDKQDFVLIGLDINKIHLLNFERLIADLREIKGTARGFSLNVDGRTMPSYEFLWRRKKACVYSADSSYLVDIALLGEVLSQGNGDHPKTFWIRHAVETEALSAFLTQMKVVGVRLTPENVEAHMRALGVNAYYRAPISVKAIDIYHYFQPLRRIKYLSYLPCFALESFKIFEEKKYLPRDLANIVMQYFDPDSKAPAPTPTNAHVSGIKDLTSSSPLKLPEISSSVPEKKYSDHSNKTLAAASLGVGSGGISVGISILLGSLSASGPIGWTLLAIGAVIFVGALLKALYDCNKRKFYEPMSPTLFPVERKNSKQEDVTIQPTISPQLVSSG